MPLATPNAVVATAYPAPIGVEQGATYAIIGPDGSRAVINDVTSSDFVGYLDSPPTGLERAGVRESADLLPEADGGVHGTFRLDRMPFTLSGIINPELPAGAGTAASWLTRQAKLLRATNALAADASLLWTPTEGPAGGVFINFRQQQPTRITGRRPKNFLVAGVAEDPTIYAQVASTVTQALTGSSGGGFASPLRSLLASTATYANAITATNNGVVTTYPVITLTGPMTNPVVTNYTLGRSLYLVYTLAAGDQLVIDTNPRRRTVRLNDQASRYSAYDYSRSTWWGLAPGANDIRIGVSAFSAGASIRLDWRDGWG